ncbi:MAG: DUF2188 domain-containing protein [Candidatus Doudnabacteria bacterium]|nr:DUF2188 domain-containing protein [Candidatus Doudnabacteria bacterium]
MAPKEIPLKRNNKNNPQIRSYTEAIKRGQRNVHIFPKDGEWKVKRIGAREEKRYSTRDEALSKAREDTGQNGGEIFIHNRNGLIETRFYSSDPYPPKN